MNLKKNVNSNINSQSFFWNSVSWGLAGEAGFGDTLRFGVVWRLFEGLLVGLFDRVPLAEGFLCVSGNLGLNPTFSNTSRSICSSTSLLENKK